jgi:hypothetical protein
MQHELPANRFVWARTLPPFSVPRGQYPEETTYLSLITLAISTIAVIWAAIRISNHRALMSFSVCIAFLGAVVWCYFLPTTLNELYIIVAPLSYSIGATMGMAWGAFLPKCGNLLRILNPG